MLIVQTKKPKPLDSYAGQRLPKSFAPELLRLPRDVVSESGSKCFFLQLLPKAAVLHGKCPSVLPFPKARLQSNGRKAAPLQTSSAQAIIRSGFRNLLPKLAMTTELPFRLGF
jgi:hypothetical protein